MPTDIFNSSLQHQDIVYKKFNFIMEFNLILGK